MQNDNADFVSAPTIKPILTGYEKTEQIKTLKKQIEVQWLLILLILCCS